MTLGKTIRIARTMKDWSQRDLSEKSGVSHAHISLIERSDRGSSMEVINRIAKALDIPAFVLLFMAGDEATQNTFGTDLRHKMWQIFYKEKT